MESNEVVFRLRDVRFSEHSLIHVTIRSHQIIRKIRKRWMIRGMKRKKKRKSKMD